MYKIKNHNSLTRKVKGDVVISSQLKMRLLFIRRRFIALTVITAIFILPVNVTQVKAENDVLVNQSSYSTEEVVYGPELPPYLASAEDDEKEEEIKEEEQETTEQLEEEPIKEETQVIEEEPVVEETPEPFVFYKENIPLDSDLQNYTYQKSLEYGIDYSIVFALMYYESRFTVSAHNKGSDCRGIMQISQRYYGKDCDLFDPYVNIEKGISMLASYYNTYRDYNKALMCYNMGCGGASSYFKKGVYSTSYSRKIINKSSEYKL